MNLEFALMQLVRGRLRVPRSRDRSFLSSGALAK